jgi:hypothetical protein
MRRWEAVAAILVLCSCVGPARSFDTYEGKAADTAESVASAVETARLAVEGAAGGRVFAPYLSVLLGEAEGDARGTMVIFASIQPPDARSDALRVQLLDLIDRAEAILSELRIAARGGELDRLPEIGSPLASIGGELAAFSEAHS